MWPLATVFRGSVSFRQTWYCIMSNWYSNLFRLFFLCSNCCCCCCLLSASFSDFNREFRIFPYFVVTMAFSMKPLLLLFFCLHYVISDNLLEFFSFLHRNKTKKDKRKDCFQLKLFCCGFTRCVMRSRKHHSNSCVCCLCGRWSRHFGMANTLETGCCSSGTMAH